MKKRICMLLLLQCMMIVLSGCSISDFFDVKSTMMPPQASKEETEIKNAIDGYLNCDFKFCQLFTGGRYSSVLKYSFGDVKYIVVFCRTDNADRESHIIILENTAGDYVVKDDIVKNNVELGSAQILDVNSGEFFELIVEGIDLTTDAPTAFSWRIYGNGTIEANS